MRFEAPLHEGRVQVAAVGVDGAPHLCTPPCDLAVRVGRTEVAVRGAARFVQPIDVPAGGTRYEFADPARGRRQAGLIGIIVGGAVTVVGVLGLLMESWVGVGRELGCGLFDGTRSCGPDDAARAHLLGCGITTAVGVAGIVASSLAGFTGPRPHLRRVPGVDVVPLRGGAGVMAGAAF